MSFKTVYVKTTGTCNLNCDHCFTSGRNGDPTRFDPNQVYGWIQDLRSNVDPDTHTHIELHGGEPFMVPIELLESFAERFEGDPLVSMGANSNLTFTIKPRMVKFIQRFLESRVGTSWDRNIRWDTQSKYQLWLDNLAFLKAAGITINLKVSVSKSLVESDPVEFLKEMSKLPVDQIALERLTVGGNSFYNPDIFPNNETQDNWYLALLKAYRQDNHGVTITTLDILIDKVENNQVKVDTNCRNCEQNIATINSDGTIGGCPNVASEQKHAHISQSAKEFLYSEGRIDEIAKELDFSEVCITCDVFSICGGDCHRLPWQGKRCGGLKNTLRYLTNKPNPYDPSIIIKV